MGAHVEVPALAVILYAEVEIVAVDVSGTRWCTAHGVRCTAGLGCML